MEWIFKFLIKACWGFVGELVVVYDKNLMEVIGYVKVMVDVF